MTTVNMKRSEVEQKGGTLLGEPVDATKEDYFYGLRITLEEPELKKLGLEDPKVGTRIQLDVVAKLVSYSQEETGRRAELLITDMGTKVSPADAQDRSDTLYKESAS